MKFSVGDLVRNQITNETGRIVRIATGIRKPGYVVVIANKVSGKELEALWGPRELKELRPPGLQSRIAVANGLSTPESESMATMTNSSKAARVGEIAGQLCDLLDQQIKTIVGGGSPNLTRRELDSYESRQTQIAALRSELDALAFPTERVTLTRGAQVTPRNDQDHRDRLRTKSNIL